MGPRDSRDPSPQGREGVAEPGGRQVGPYGLRGRWHRLEAVRLAPGLEVGQIGSIGPEGRLRICRGLVGLGPRHGERAARGGWLLPLGESGQLPGLSIIRHPPSQHVILDSGRSILTYYSSIPFMTDLYPPWLAGRLSTSASLAIVHQWASPFAPGRLPFTFRVT